MPMIVTGNIVEAKIFEGVSERTGNAYRMVSAQILVDFGSEENPRKDLISVQMDSEFPVEAVENFMKQINRDQFQKVDLRVKNLSARPFGNGNSAQNVISVEFLNPRIEIPKAEKEKTKGEPAADHPKAETKPEAKPDQPQK